VPDHPAVETARVADERNVASSSAARKRPPPSGSPSAA